MSPKNGSPNTHFLPSFISSDKLTSHSLWVAGCNKGVGVGEELSTLAWFQSRKVWGKQCLKWNPQGGKFQLKAKRRQLGLDVSLWSMSPEVGTGDGPLSFFMLERGSERASVLPLSLSLCLHICVGCLTWSLHTGWWRETREARGHVTEISAPFFFPSLPTWMYFLSNETKASVENCLHFPDQKKCKVSAGLCSIMGMDSAAMTLTPSACEVHLQCSNEIMHRSPVRGSICFWKKKKQKPLPNS